ncbi:reverse transcriptase domain-containing protein [Tanacetum coccineum]
MRTRSQTRNRNRRQQQQTLPVVVEPCNLEEPIPEQTIVAMADRTMEELLRAPTEGYGEAIVLPEINADHFEIKTNLLQLVQANPFHEFDESFSEAWERFKGMLRSCPHHGFSELTQVDTFYNGLNENEQDSLNAAAGGNLLSKTTREALNIIENKSKVRYSRNKTNASRVNSKENVSKTDERIDKLADQLSTLVEIVSKKVVVPPAPVKAVEENCVTCGGAHAWYNCPATDNNQNVCATTGTYNQQAPPNRVSNQMAPPGFAPVQNQGQNRNYNNQGQGIIQSAVNNFQNQGIQDIYVLEQLLNDDPFQLPPMDLKQSEVTEAKSSIEEPPKLELKDFPSHLEHAYLEENDKLPVIIANRKLNEATRKDHFHLPFLVKILERLAFNESFVLRRYLGYFQIPIDPQDQEKTTFTCPYGTFAYRRMPFGLCNAPGTFQRCMMAIFHDMIEKTMEVCEDTNLVLNWEKCHFMCKEGIVLGHKISKSGIEVDRAKIDVIAKLPHPTTVKGVRSFLGHAGFYRRFIQDFSKISRPITHLLEKDTPFVFSQDCINAFETLKKKLTEAPILVVPDWNLPFELMCDASDFAIGAVLGQRKTKHFQPIHYASKTMTEAQIHYTTTEKEMLAVVYAFEKFRPYLVLSKSIVYTYPLPALNTS